MQPAESALRASFARAAWRWLLERATGLGRAIWAETRARATRRELEALSDHMLRDIGLRRDQIEFIARRETSRPPAGRTWPRRESS
jgi:uncharacterized protein YjiS (DUF1127 family)